MVIQFGGTPKMMRNEENGLNETYLLFFMVLSVMQGIPRVLEVLK